MYSSHHYAVRGAAAVAITAAVLFGVSGWYAVTSGKSHVDSFLLAAPLCGIAAGLAYGRRLFLAVVLGLGFGIAGFMFTMQEFRSGLLVDVVFTGIVTASTFWIIGACVTLTFPPETRFNAAKTFAIPGGFAGIAFQIVYGPVRLFLNPAGEAWWAKFAWEYLLLWLIAGVGGAWSFGMELDRREHQRDAKRTNRTWWAAACVMLGTIGLGAAAFYLLRDDLPLGLMDDFSPAYSAADWLLSWGLVVGIFGYAGWKSTRRRWAALGTAAAVTMLVAAGLILTNPRENRFNRAYAERLLRDHGHPGDEQYGYAVYKGNLILAQAALDVGDIGNASRYLLEAGTTTGFRKIEQNGPDTSVVRVLLQQGQRDTVLEYLHRCRTLWPQGVPLLDRWETLIRAGRQPNFNNRQLLTLTEAAR